MNTIIYVDMDGVIADFDKAIRTYFPSFEEKCKSLSQKGQEDLVDYICLHNPRIFYHLDLIYGAKEGLDWLISQKHLDIYLLSTPMWCVPESFMDKRLWVEEHFPALEKRLILTHHKDLLHGDYLIDDRKVHGVEKFKGVHIHFRTDPVFMTWQDIVNNLKNSFEWAYGSEHK